MNFIIESLLIQYTYIVLAKLSNFKSVPLANSSYSTKVVSTVIISCEFYQHCVFLTAASYAINLMEMTAHRSEENESVLVLMM